MSDISDIDDQSEKIERPEIKTGIIIILEIINKLGTKRDFRNYTSKDWRDIADKVAEYSGNTSDSSSYSLFVFSAYAQYIKASVDILGGRTTESTRKQILSLADKLLENNRELKEGKISETDYTENCLWTSLEAVIELMAAYSLSGDKESEQFREAVSMCAFEFARYSLYNKEKSLLDEWKQHRNKIDEELKHDYDEFLIKLKEESAEYQKLILSSSADDLRTRLYSSIALARKAGVPEDQILKSKEDADAFFLS